MKILRAAFLAGLAAAGCGGVRMSAVERDRATGELREYDRHDPDARASALESAGGEGCREALWGRWALALCPEPDRLRAGVPAALRFQAEESLSGVRRPVTGASVVVTLRHHGEREPRGMTHPDPAVSPVRETAPGAYEATASFPAPGQWTVQTDVTFPDGEKKRLRFDVTVAPAAPGRGR